MFAAESMSVLRSARSKMSVLPRYQDISFVNALLDYSIRNNS